MNFYCFDCGGHFVSESYLSIGDRGEMRCQKCTVSRQSEQTARNLLEVLINNSELRERLRELLREAP